LGKLAEPPDSQLYLGDPLRSAEKKRQGGQGKRKGEGKGRKEWRKRGRDGEEMEEVDFAPSCKNSCGRP